MNIYYINLDTFDKTKIILFAKEKCGIVDFKNNLHNFQHYAGLYLLHFCGKKYYDIQTFDLSYKHKKPYLQNDDIKFNISHSKNIVAIIFDNTDIGLDVEYNKKKRNFEKIINKINKKTDIEFMRLNDIEKQKYFYDFWTKHEAKIKLGVTKEKIFYKSNYEIKDFTITVAALHDVNIEKTIDINT